MKKLISGILLATLLLSGFAFADVVPTDLDQAQVSTTMPIIYTVDTATEAMLENSISLKLAQFAIDASKINASKSGRAVDKLELLGDMGIGSTDIHYAERGVLDKAAELDVLMSERTKDATEVGLKIALKQSFYGIISAQDTLKIKEQSAERLKELNAISIQKYKLGLVSRNALNATQVDYDAAVSAVDAAKRDLEYKKMVFNQTMDLPLQTPFELQGALEYSPAVITDLKEKIALGMTNRLDVVASKIGEEIAAVTFTVDQMYYTPNTYFYQNSYITTEKAKFSYNQTVMSAELDIRKAFNDYKGAEETYLNLKKSLMLLKDGYEIAKTMYGVGLNTQTDVSNALIQYNSMEVNVNSALLGYKLAEMSFEASYAIGLK